jgi:hypothetical protein
MWAKDAPGEFTVIAAAIFRACEIAKTASTMTPETGKQHFRFYRLPDLLLRVYEASHASSDHDLHTRALDAWDNYLEADMSTARDKLNELMRD